MREFLEYNNFKQNEYYEEYLELITEETSEEIFERHHRLPKSMGGSNDEDNMVSLSYQNHYRAHELLPFFCSNEGDHNKMVHAWNILCIREGVVVTAIEYAVLKEELLGIRQEHVILKNEAGEIFYVKNDDPRWLSGELFGLNRGMITVRDSEGNTFQISTDDPRWISGELVGATTGYPVSAETKIILSEVSTEYWSDHENREAHSQWLKDYYADPELGEKRKALLLKGNISRTQKLENDPEYARNFSDKMYKHNVEVNNDPVRKSTRDEKCRRNSLEQWKELRKDTEKNAARSKKLSLAASRPILQLTLANNIIKEWSSGRAASDGVSLKSSGTASCASGHSETSAGFKWIWVKDIDDHPGMREKYDEFKKS